MCDPYFHVHQYGLTTERSYFKVSDSYTLHPKTWFQRFIIWWLCRKGVFQAWFDYSSTVTWLDLPKANLFKRIIFAINYIRSNECLPYYEPKLIIMDHKTADELFATPGIGPYLAFVGEDLGIKTSYGIGGDYKLMNDVMIKIVPWIKGWCVV